jgi:TolA-binding protein
MSDRRITRQEMKHDEVADTLGHWMNWIEDNWQKSLAAVVGLILFILLAFTAMNWSRSSNEAKSAELGKAASVLGAGVQAEGANPTDPLSPTFATAKARDEAALAGIDAYVARNGQDATAAYYRGVALMRLGRGSEAEEALKKASEGSQVQIAGLARHAMASCAMTRGDWATAEQRLKDLVATPPAGYPVDLLLLELARAQKAGGKAEDARATEERLRAEFPDSPVTAELRSAGGDPGAF